MKEKFFPFFIIIVTLSVVDYVFIDVFGSIRAYHFAFLLVAYITWRNRKIKVNNKRTKEIIRVVKSVFFILIPANIILMSILNNQINNLAITLYGNLVINVLFFLMLLNNGLILRAESFRKILLFVIYVFFVFHIIDFISINFLGNSVFKYLVNNPDGYKVGQLFANDPNWEAAFSLFLGLISMTLSKKLIINSKDFNKVAIITLITLLFTESRIALAIFMVFIIYMSNNRIKFVFYYFGLLFFVLISYVGYKQIFDASYYYDILDLARNPRLNDFMAIYYSLRAKGVLLFGGGFGQLNNYATYITWRENTNVSNVFIIQIIGEYGFFGLLFFFILIIYLLKVVKNKYSRFLLLCLILFIQFHNMLYRNQFWIILALWGILNYHLETKRARIIV